MRGISGNADASASGKDRIERRDQRGPESFFGPFVFPAICRDLLGLTAKDLATIGDAHPRTAEFWLSGKVEMPPSVIVEIVAEGLRRDRAKRAARKR